MKRQSIFNKILGIILSVMIMAEPMVAFSAPKKDKPAASKTSSKKSSAAKKSSTKTKNKSNNKATSSKSKAKKKSAGTSAKTNKSKNSKKSTGNKNVKNQKSKTKVVEKKVCKKVKGKTQCKKQKVTVPVESNNKTKIIEKKVCKKVKGKRKCKIEKIKVPVTSSNTKQQQTTSADDAGQTKIQSKEIVERESLRDSENKQRSDDLLMSAMSLLGVSYRFGGSSPTSGMDCSGFIQYIFRQALNVNLPRTSAEMATVGRPVDKSDLQAGDLVFFARNGKRIGHVGMYIGEGKFIHAPRTGKDIEIQSLNKPYYVKTYAGARRVSSSTRKSKITE